MNFGSRKRKLRLAAGIVESIAQSASHAIDPFGFVGFDEIVREDWISTASAKSYRAIEMAENLKEYHPPPVGSEGLLDIYRYLPRDRKSVVVGKRLSVRVYLGGGR